MGSEELKPLELWSIAFPNSPNPWKVAIILEELGLKYNIKLATMTSVKQAPFTDMNPNGRTPCIVDPNNGGLVLWESVAIIHYLIDQYDTTSKISFVTGPEKYHVYQWQLFQASGQGPYFGQAIWFTHIHFEGVPSAIKRYRDEIRRVLEVLEVGLMGKDYLVGGKCTVADLGFVSWNNIIPFACQEDTDIVLKGLPNVEKWMARLMERPSVKTVLFDKRDQMSKPMPKIIKTAISTLRNVNGFKLWITGGRKVRDINAAEE